MNKPPLLLFCITVYSTMLPCCYGRTDRADMPAIRVFKEKSPHLDSPDRAKLHLSLSP